MLLLCCSAHAKGEKKRKNACKYLHNLTPTNKDATRNKQQRKTTMGSSHVRGKMLKPF